MGSWRGDAWSSDSQYDRHATAKQSASIWVLIESVPDELPAVGIGDAAPIARTPRAQGERVARQTAEQSQRAAPRGFGTQPRSPYRTCKPRKSSWEWKPEPDKIGMAGPMPYVRLGKRCVIGLGFFGCALGELPPANGELLDDLREPDRRTSSVPGPEHCEQEEPGGGAASDGSTP